MFTVNQHLSHNIPYHRLLQTDLGSWPVFLWFLLLRGIGYCRRPAPDYGGPSVNPESTSTLAFLQL